MDTLERILSPGRDLLARVDAALLTGGAPAEHPIWPLLRRVGALPGEAAESLAGLRPAALESSAAELRALAGECARRRAAVGAATEWTGAAAEAFGARWAHLGTFLGATAEPDEPSLAGRLAATAGYLDEVATWMRSARGALAEGLATVLASAEAVRLRVQPAQVGPPGAPVLAAAAGIGVRILDTAATASDDGAALPERWVVRLGELTYRSTIETGALRQGTPTTVRL